MSINLLLMPLIAALILTVSINLLLLTTDSTLTISFSHLRISPGWPHVLKEEEGPWRRQLERNLGIFSLEQAPEIPCTASPGKGDLQEQKNSQEAEFLWIIQLPHSPL